jgi:EmrB/QacA subfamily drug resistance transporter
MTDLPRNSAPPVYRTATDPKLGLLIPLVVACALFMENLDSTIIATSIPQIAQSLGESPLHLNLAVTSYLLSLAVFIPISGWVADRFGARNVFCSAIVMFTVGSALCGLSTSLAMLIATRILQGLGGAMMTPVGRLILLRSFPKEALVQAMTYVTIPALIGPTMGPLVGGFLTTYVSWRWIFYINIPIGLVGITLALRYIDDTKMPAPPRFDFTGFAICGVALASMELVLESAGRQMVPLWGEVALGTLAIGGMVLYRRHAHRTPNPAVDLKIFRFRSFSLSVLAGGVCRMGLSAVPFLLPLQLQLGFGMTAMQSGAITFVSSLGAILMKSASPPILRRFGFRNLLIGNGLLVGVLITGMAAFTAATPHVLLYAYLLLFGFMRSVQFTCLNTLGYADIPPDMMSRGTSVSSVGQQLSMSFGVAIGATLLGLLLGDGGTVTASEFRTVYPLVAILPTVGSLFFFRLLPTDGMQVSGYRPRAESQAKLDSAKPAASSNAPAP